MKLFYCIKINISIHSLIYSNPNKGNTMSAIEPHRDIIQNNKIEAFKSLVDSVNYNTNPPYINLYEEPNAKRDIIAFIIESLQTIYKDDWNAHAQQLTKDIKKIQEHKESTHGQNLCEALRKIELKGKALLDAYLIFKVADKPAYKTTADELLNLYNKINKDNEEKYKKGNLVRLGGIPGGFIPSFYKNLTPSS